MTEKGEKLLILAAGIFLLAAIAVMVFVYQLDEGDFVTVREGSGLLEEAAREEYFEASAGEDADIIIPLPEAGEGQFHIEDSSGRKKLTIVLEGVDEEFFYGHKIKGNEEKISRIQFAKEGESTSLIFSFYHVYDAQARVEGNEIRISLSSPAAGAERIVVLDGVSESCEEEVEDRLSSHQIKGILNGDIAAANELRAECFVFLEKRNVSYMPGGNGPVEVTIYYNDDYFIPEFDSRSLAEIFSGYYNEFHSEWKINLEKSDDLDLMSAMVPAVRIICWTPDVQGQELLIMEEGSIEELTLNALIEQYGESVE